jgi:hypothetical protein
MFPVKMLFWKRGEIEEFSDQRTAKTIHCQSTSLRKNSRKFFSLEINHPRGKMETSE